MSYQFSKACVVYNSLHRPNWHRTEHIRLPTLVIAIRFDSRYILVLWSAWLHAITYGIENESQAFIVLPHIKPHTQ